jgi:hypothetical protein
MSNNGIIHWLPRILAILYAIFISIFAFDAPEILGIFTQLIPPAIILVALFLARKNDSFGSILFFFIGIIFTIFFNTLRDMTLFFVISFPLFLIAGLFAFKFFNHQSS